MSWSKKNRVLSLSVRDLKKILNNYYQNVKVVHITFRNMDGTGRHKPLPPRLDLEIKDYN